MTAAERSEMLIRIDERTKRIDKLLCGNGQPGLIKDFKRLDSQHQIVYDRQNKCIASQKENKLDFKWLVLLLITLFALIKEFLF